MRMTKARRLLSAVLEPCMPALPFVRAAIVAAASAAQQPASLSYHSNNHATNWFDENLRDHGSIDRTRQLVGRAVGLIICQGLCDGDRSIHTHRIDARVAQFISRPRSTDCHAGRDHLLGCSVYRTAWVVSGV